MASSTAERWVDWSVDLMVELRVVQWADSWAVQTAWRSVGPMAEAWVAHLADESESSLVEMRAAGSVAMTARQMAVRLADNLAVK